MRDPFGLDASNLDDGDPAEYEPPQRWGDVLIDNADRRKWVRPTLVGMQTTAEVVGESIPVAQVVTTVGEASQGHFVPALVGFLGGAKFDRIRKLPGRLGVVRGVCFPAGTLIATDAGNKAIERMQPGDRVLSADERTGKQSYQLVTRTFVREADELLTLVTADGRRVEATPEHPFWVVRKGFVEARRLARSDLLLDVAGRAVPVVEITSRRGRFRVYNFEVEQTHTYYANGWWVHNKCRRTFVTLTRRKPGRDGAISPILKERIDGETVSIIHQVEKEGKIIHQHQTHIGRYGTQRQFPEEWIEFPDIGVPQE